MRVVSSSELNDFFGGASEFRIIEKIHINQNIVNCVASVVWILEMKAAVINTITFDKSKID